MAKTVLAGCILAGGRSLRMGRDKRVERLGGKTLIEHAIDRLRPQVDGLMINANEGCEAFGLPVRADSISGHAGPLAGMLAGLSWAAEIGAQALVTIPADTPFFPRDLVARLMEVSDRDIVCAASGGRLHPVFSLWHGPQQFLTPLERALHDEQLRKVETFVARYRHGTVDWPIGEYDPFFNINTPQELTEAERIIAECFP